MTITAPAVETVPDAPPARRDPRPAATRTVAVLGSRDSGSRDLADALAAAAAGAGLEVVVDASADRAPDCAVLAVDAVCPIRPDDVTVAARVASRVPTVVVLTGVAGRDGIAETVDVTTLRLRAAGVPAPVLVAAPDPGGSPSPGVPVVDPAGLVAALGPDRLPGLAVHPPAPVRTDAADGPVATADWLAARRTEAIAGRSSALRQDVQELRLDLVQELHRGLRELGARAREEIGAAPVRALPGVVERLADDADEAARAAVRRADRGTESLVTRHLGVRARPPAAVAAPRCGLRLTDAPRHRGEEALMLVMGAAGGTGVGRMLLTPLAELPALVVPASLAAGVALGATTVLVRRTQARRAHMTAVATDRLATLRAETEQAIGARLLLAEAQVTDGFAHDPGPRVADLERRLRRARAATDRTEAGATRR